MKTVLWRFAHLLIRKRKIRGNSRNLIFFRSLVTVASMNGGNVLSAFVEAYRIEFSAIDDHLRNLEDVDKISAYPQARYYPERCGLEG